MTPSTGQSSSTQTASSTSGSPRFFGSASFWNAPLSLGAPLDPNSTAIVNALNQIEAKEAPNNQLNVNTTAYSVPIYTVPAGQPTVKVTLNKGANSAANPLQTAWEAVPLPPGAQPAKGTDKHLVVWQPSADKMWEFWDFENTATGPVAKWGGAMQDVTGNSGVYTPTAWPQLLPNLGSWELDVNSWGATGTSLPVVGGLITLEDLEKGRIEHALAMAVPDARAKEWAAPAYRSDGSSTEATSLPEGAHLRLDPELDLSALHLGHFVLMLAEAAQRYGIIVRDYSPNIVFYAQDPTPTGTNPYTARGGYFEGKCACKLLASFPWSHLQLLKMELRTK